MSVQERLRSDVLRAIARASCVLPAYMIADLLFDVARKQLQSRVGDPPDQPFAVVPLSTSETSLGSHSLVH
jgi:hypothetical protein